MIEIIIFNYLKTALSPVVVKTEYPKTQPAKFVVLEKTGSNSINHIKSATIAIQSIADSLLKAAELNEQVKAAMENMVELDGICNVQLNSDYNFTDTSTKQYRYQAVFDIKHY